MIGRRRSPMAGGVTSDSGATSVTTEAGEGSRFTGSSTTVTSPSFDSYVIGAVASLPNNQLARDYDLTVSGSPVCDTFEFAAFATSSSPPKYLPATNAVLVPAGSTVTITASPSLSGGQTIEIAPIFASLPPG